MKLITFLLLFFTCWSSVVPTEAYDDFTKIECSSSSTSINQFCELSQGNELNYSITFGCELQRALSPVFVSMIQEHNVLIKLRLSFFHSSAFNSLSKKTMSLTYNCRQNCQFLCSYRYINRQ